MSETPRNLKPKQPDAIRLDALELLRTLKRGDVAADLSAQLDQVVQAVHEKGGKGRVTLVIDVQRADDYGQDALRFNAEASVKLPKPEPHRDFRFLTDQGTLSVDDPRQLVMKFAQEKP